MNSEAPPTAAAPGRAEDKIRENEWFLQAVFDGIQDGISVLDRELNILRVNRTMEQWYAHAVPLPGKKCYLAYHLRGEPCRVCPTRNAMDKGTPQMEQIPLTGPAGVEGWLELYAFPMFDSQGNAIGVIEYVRNITKRRRAEDALRKSQQLLAKTFASLREAVFIVDGETSTIIDCNPAASATFGYGRDEMLGRPMVFLHPDDAAAEEFERQLHTALEKQGFLFLPELTMRRKDGRTFPTEHSVMSLEDEQGQPIGWVSVVRDIAERKRMEQYALRTERLAAMGRLAAALAHEIGNPLQGIDNSLELLMDFPLDDAERQEYLHAVRREIERLKALTGRVLDFARPAQVDRRPTAVAGVVRHALALSEKQLQQEQIEVRIDLPDDLPLVLASGDHLAQVFINLVINAIEAMPDGGVLGVSARHARGEVEITFADTGTGIPDGAGAMIFEPFYTTKEDGTGLGLSTSHSIVEQHGGTITARNAHGGGAVFTVSLPAIGPAGACRREGQAC